MTHYAFTTGGVVSSLGKGIATASLGALLEARGLKVSLVKLDPYINVDPGTMSPFQHGEVFVTEDGAETDLDLGHYERFTDANTSRGSNVTAGAIKTKPTQHSVNELRRIGIQPDMVVCRSEGGLPHDVRKKIALFASLPQEAIVSARDVDNIYKVPLYFHAEGVDDFVLDHFAIDAPPPDLADWERLMRAAREATE